MLFDQTLETVLVHKLHENAEFILDDFRSQELNNMIMLEFLENSYFLPQRLHHWLVDSIGQRDHIDLLDRYFGLICFFLQQKNSALSALTKQLEHFIGEQLAFDLWKAIFLVFFRLFLHFSLENGLYSLELLL